MTSILFNNFDYKSMDMKKSFNLYFMYCINIQCDVSIYHKNIEVKIPLTSENLLAKHSCTCCNKPLSSAIDLEPKQLAAYLVAKKYRSGYSVEPQL